MPNTDEIQSAILKALADENRIRLLRLLSREVLNVQELCEILELPQPRVSRHLSVLRGIGLVTDQREGSRVYYRIAQLDGEFALIAEYLGGISGQDHPDLERMEAVLRRRTRASRDFAREQAGHWDLLGRELHSSTAALLGLAEMAPRGLVLADLGAGTGLLLPVLASFAGKVYAVDHSSEMLDYARKRCAEQGAENVEFLCCGLDDLPQALPEACDCMLMHFVLHQLARPLHILRTVTKGLKPGGRLVIVDRTKHEDEEARRKFGSLWLGFERETIRNWLEAADLHEFVYHELRPDQDPGLTGIFVAASMK